MSNVEWVMKCKAAAATFSKVYSVEVGRHFAPDFVEVVLGSCYDWTHADLRACKQMTKESLRRIKRSGNTDARIVEALFGEDE